jgi:hypothetical protein
MDLAGCRHVIDMQPLHRMAGSKARGHCTSGSKSKAGRHCTRDYSSVLCYWQTVVSLTPFGDLLQARGGFGRKHGDKQTNHWMVVPR